MLDFVNKLLAFGTILSQLFIVAVVLYFLLRKSFPKIPVAIKELFAWTARHGLLLAFLASLAASLASLFYSNIVGFEPCELCWYQRIFMYPLAVILGIAYFNRDNNIFRYAMPLAIIGFIISLYQNGIYYNMGGLSAICDFSGIGVSCTKRYIFEFGYITIPIMALTAFVLVITLLVLKKMDIKNS